MAIIRTKSYAREQGLAKNASVLIVVRRNILRDDFFRRADS